MQEEDLRAKAKKAVDLKVLFYLLAAIFLAVSMILLVLSSFIEYPASFWLRFPVLIFSSILGVMYLIIFGVPHFQFLTEQWREEEIEREVYKLDSNKRRMLPPPEELSETDRLELKELERLKQKWENDDFV